MYLINENKPTLIGILSAYARHDKRRTKSEAARKDNLVGIVTDPTQIIAMTVGVYRNINLQALT